MCIRDRGLGEPWQAERLFYTVIPRAFFERMRQEMEKLGDDTTGFDDSEQDIRGWPDSKINLVINVSSTVVEKWEALECHRTQFGPGNLFNRIPEAAAREMMGEENFYLAWPGVEPGNQLGGFFSGLENFSID
jgi:LmbE family N-acetylglucosaminyl deacetylase